MSGNKANILGVVIDSTSASSVLNTIVGKAKGDVIASPSEVEGEAISSGTRPNNHGIASSQAPRNDNLVVFTPNPEFVVEAQADSDFKQLLNKADISLPDGIGLVWAGKLLGQTIKERISGADMVEKLLEEGNRKPPFVRRFGGLRKGRQGTVNSHEGWKIGIVGARRGVINEVEELIRRLGEKYPNITFVNLDNVIARNPADSAGDEAIPNEMRLPRGKTPRNDRFHIVFACHGMKKQEKWIWENKDKISTNVFMGVGGSLDFLTGFTKRAPKVMRRIGLEWLWRGIQRPGHWRRIWRATVVFGGMVAKELLTQRSKCKNQELIQN